MMMFIKIALLGTIMYFSSMAMGMVMALSF